MTFFLGDITNKTLNILAQDAFLCVVSNVVGLGSSSLVLLFVKHKWIVTDGTF